jgi:hypothetical protein
MGARGRLQTAIELRYRGWIIAGTNQNCLRKVTFDGPDESKYTLTVVVGYNNMHNSAATRQVILKDVCHLYALIFQHAVDLRHVTIEALLCVPGESVFGELDCVLRTTVLYDNAKTMNWELIEKINPIALWGTPSIMHSLFS